MKFPQSVEARMRTGGAKQPLKDKLATTLLFSSLIVGFLLCPLDLFYWQIAEAAGQNLKII